MYLIISPIDGKISFSSFWTENQNINIGDDLFYIVPNQKQHFIAKGIVSMTNSGKLQIGQKVNIKLENYASNENGMLEGILENIADVPNATGYQIDIKLPYGLKTSYNKTLVYKQQMKGKAEIITKKMSIADRVLFNFKKLLDKGKNQ